MLRSVPAGVGFGLGVDVAFDFGDGRLRQLARCIPDGGEGVVRDRKEFDSVLVRDDLELFAELFPQLFELIEAEGREEPDASPVTSGPNNAESPIQYWRAKIRRIFVRQYQSSSPRITRSVIFRGSSTSSASASVRYPFSTATSRTVLSSLSAALATSLALS